MRVEDRREVGVLHRPPPGGAAGAVHGDAVGPLGVDTRVDTAGGGDVEHRRVGVEHPLGVRGLARARPAEDQRAQDRPQAIAVPRATRGAGIRRRRSWVARVNAYQP